MIKETVQMYLDQVRIGKTSMSDELIEEAVERVRTILKKQFQDHEDKFKVTLRMSSVGKPLCQQQLAHSGAETDPPWNGYAHVMQMVLGDLHEAVGVAVLKAALGDRVQNVDQEVHLDIGGIDLKGTYDIKIDNKIYDIKTSSETQWRLKWTAPDAFNQVRASDHFGYTHQGYLYAQADKSQFGGWIVLNKSTGEWTVVSTPVVDNMYRKEALEVVNKNIKAVINNEPFKRLFELKDETFNKKKTGNKILGMPCTYCEYKSACWGAENLQLLDQPKSKALKPPKNYYYGEVKE